jgi:hypothetical protein
MFPTLWTGVSDFPSVAVPAVTDVTHGTVGATSREILESVNAFRCAALADALEEPLAGTSAVARSWLAVEQPGRWGHGVARDLAAVAAGTGVRIVLIRRPGSGPDRGRPAPRTAYLAHTVPGRTWLERTTVTDPGQLRDLDLARAGAGDRGLLGTPVSERVLLVCTNGRRDVCCALRGRPIAAELAATHGDQVWECTHIGGHRFAPTAVLLPTGYSYGRLTTAFGARLLAGGPLVENCRGRSTWSPAGQIAELAVRSATGDEDPDTVTVTGIDDLPDGGGLVTVAHVDGRSWRVTVAQQPMTDQPASCDGEPNPDVTFRVVSVRTWS